MLLQTFNDLVSEEWLVYDYTLIMKAQWNISESNTQLSDVEKGLHQEKQKREKRIKYKTNCCTRCIPYLRLIFLLEVTFIFGWGCYMLFQTYRSEEVKNEATDITLERYSSMIKSVSEIEKSRSNAEMSMVLVKPEAIIDKINNLLKGIKEDQNLMENKAIVTNVSSMQTNTENSSNVRNYNINAVNRLLTILSSENLVHDKKFIKRPIPLLSVEDTNKNIDTNENAKSTHAQFFEKLRNISKIITNCNLERFESRNDFTEDVNHLESQKNHTLKENLTENSIDYTSKDLTNILQDSEQEFLKQDVIKNTAQDRNENNSLFEETNKRVNLELGFVIFPPYEFQEFSDISVEGSGMSSFTSQSLLAQKNSEQMENRSSDNTDERNENKQDINDSDMSMSASTSGNRDNFDILRVTAQNIEKQHSFENIADIKKDNKYESMENIKNSNKLWFLQPTMQNSVESSTLNVDKFDWFNSPSYLLDLWKEGIPKSSEMHSSLLEDTYEDDIKKDNKYESMENIKNSNKLSFLQPTMQNSVESSTPNVDKFDWSKDPRDYLGWMEGIPNSSKIRSSLLEDTYEDMDVDDVIPESQCKTTIKMGILKVKCPAIKFDEEWDLTSSEVPLTNVSKVNNFGDIFGNIYLLAECDKDANKKLKIENISNENSDKEITILLDSVSKIINAIKLQKRSINEIVLNEACINALQHRGEINQDYLYDYNSLSTSSEEEVKQITTVFFSIPECGSTTIDSNKEQNSFFDISSTEQQEQLKVSKEKDYSVSDNSETFLEDLEHFHSLKKNLTFQLKHELLNIMAQYLLKSSSSQNNLCSIFRYMSSISQRPWNDQYVALRKLLEYIRNYDNLHIIDDSYHRKKRMIDDLTWQHNQVPDTLEVDDKNVDLLENLKKIYLKMEILALCIDRLHERYLLHNKLDDDYTSSEFPIETELYTSRIVYEK